MKVWIDGSVVEGSEARVPVVDHGFLYGDGIFEGIRVYARRVFRLDQHLRRLETSAKAIALEIPGGIERAREVVLETARAVGADEAYIRLIVTRGEGPLGVDPTTCPHPRMICIVDEVELFPAERAARGVSLVTASLRKPDPDVLDPRVKSLNYLNSVLAKGEARRQGADDALVLNGRGAVAEASGANLFCVRDGELLTPPATDGSLQGVTRGAVMEVARGLGIPVYERTLWRVDLFGADEVFLTGTGARVVAARSLDGVPLGAAPPGPMTRQLTEAFFALARSTGTPID